MSKIVNGISYLLTVLAIPISLSACLGKNDGDFQSDISNPTSGADERTKFRDCSAVHSTTADGQNTWKINNGKNSLGNLQFFLPTVSEETKTEQALYKYNYELTHQYIAATQAMNSAY